MSKRQSKKISDCNRQISNKYTSRPSPPYPANQCENQIKIGNDGKKYISLCSFETGICKWVKYSKELIKKREEELELILKRRRLRMRELNKKSSRIQKRRRSKKQTK